MTYSRASTRACARAKRVMNSMNSGRLANAPESDLRLELFTSRSAILPEHFQDGVTGEESRVGERIPKDPSPARPCR